MSNHHFPKDYRFVFLREETQAILTKTRADENADYKDQLVWVVAVTSCSHGKFETILYPHDVHWTGERRIMPDA